MKAFSLSQFHSTDRPFSFWVEKNWYYHQNRIRSYQFIIPPESKILQIGCKNGYLLNALKPSLAVGIDTEKEPLEQGKSLYPHLNLYLENIENFSYDDTFDYVILSEITMESHNIQELLTSLKKFCNAQTRLIIDIYSWAWEPLLRFASYTDLRRKTSLKNWISLEDMYNFLYLAGFQVVKTERTMLIPFYIPFFSTFLNVFIAPLPGINKLCLMQWIIARPLCNSNKSYSTSIIIPCKNERGTIEAAVKRCPSLGSSTEIIFVEGHSQDNTLEEIKRVQALYPGKNISYAIQAYKGKGDAVRLGFEKAQGQILFILDADLTVPPEDLTKFYAMLAEGRGELINGSRLVYGMEKDAMRFLNMIANYFFGRMFSWLLGQKIKDTLCGTKVLFKKDYEKIKKNRAYFGNFDPFGDFDLLFGAAKQNLKIIDLPVRYKARTYGSTQIHRFSHGILLLKMCFYALGKFKFR